MKKLLFAAAVAALSSVGLSAQAVIWSINPAVTPFNSAINNVTVGPAAGQLTSTGGNWGMAFYPWQATTGAMTAPLLSDYTFTSNLTSSVAQGSFNINLVFRDIGGGELASLQRNQSINGSTTQVVATLDQFSGSSGLLVSELPSVHQIEFFVGGITNAGTVNFGVQQLQIPEPSTYAAIAGALALGLVAYRRRR